MCVCVLIRVCVNLFASLFIVCLCCIADPSNFFSMDTFSLRRQNSFCCSCWVAIWLFSQFSRPMFFLKKKKTLLLNKKERKLCAHKLYYKNKSLPVRMNQSHLTQFLFIKCCNHLLNGLVCAFWSIFLPSDKTLVKILLKSTQHLFFFFFLRLSDSGSQGSEAYPSCQRVKGRVLLRQASTLSQG